MDELQTLSYVKTKLAARDWTGASNRVFGGVVLTAGLPDEPLLDLITPIALIVPGSGAIDQKQPGVCEYRFSVRVLVEVEGDESGELALIGGPRSSGESSSLGAGILQVQRELLDELLLKTKGDGLYVQLIAQSSTNPALVGNTRFLVYRDYQFKVLGTTLPDEE